jgi:predicted PurR-regulated permease PerM
MNSSERALSRNLTRTMMIVFLSLLLVCAVFAAYFAREVIVTATIGVALGVLLIPCVRFAREKLHLPKSIGAALMALFLIGLIAGTGYLIGHLLSSQLVPILEGTTKAVNKAAEAVQKTQGAKTATFVQKVLSNIDLSTAAKHAAEIAAAGVKISVAMAVGIIAVIVIAVYLAAEAERYEWILLSLFPECHRAEVRRAARLSAHALRVWFGSQVINLLIIGTVTGVGLWLVGIPSWAALGAIAGITEIIPYVGPILSGIIALAITLASDPQKFWWVLILCTAIHQLENHLVVPLILRGAASLPPVPLIITMLIMGSWFGILGVLLSAPLVSVVRALYLEMYVPRMDRWKHPVLPPVLPPPESEIKAA